MGAMASMSGRGQGQGGGFGQRITSPLFEGMLRVIMDGQNKQLASQGSVNQAGNVASGTLSSSKDSDPIKLFNSAFERRKKASKQNVTGISPAQSNLFGL